MRGTYDHELALAYAALPLSELAPLVSYPYTPFFFDSLNHATNDGYWRRWALQQRYDHIAASGLHIGGWWDIFLAGTLENFTGITAATTTTQRCVVGPWTHSIEESQLHCECTGGVVRNPLDRWHLDSFNHTLRDADDPSGTAGQPLRPASSPLACYDDLAAAGSRRGDLVSGE